MKRYNVRVLHDLEGQWWYRIDIWVADKLNNLGEPGVYQHYSEPYGPYPTAEAAQAAGTDHAQLL